MQGATPRADRPDLDTFGQQLVPKSKRSDRLRLIASVLATFFRSPLQFFFPPKQDDATPVHGPVSVPPPAAH